MKLSTKARYGLRLMVSLAEHYEQGTVFLKDVAKEQDLSEKYLSRIVIDLRSAGLVDAFRGANGGYKLMRAPYSITVRQIVDALEDITPVECVQDWSICERSGHCSAREVWRRLDEAMDAALQQITLADMLAWGQQKNEQYAMYYI